MHVLRTHRNMRLHFAAAIVILVAAVWVGVTRFELIALMLAIAFVLVAEMINSAVEQAIDVATTSFDPLAKLAKDIAAGAVLIAAVTAVAIGYLVFSRRLGEPSDERDRSAAQRAGDRDARRARPRDADRDRDEGVDGSRHAAARRAAVRARGDAFAGWMAVTYIVGADEHRFIVSSIMFIMAVLVAETRVEAGFHSTLEVTYGGLLGALVTLAVFQLFFD